MRKHYRIKNLRKYSLVEVGIFCEDFGRSGEELVAWYEEMDYYDLILNGYSLSMIKCRQIM